MPTTTEKLKACEWWIARGFAILPAQPNRKYLYKGFGEYQKKFTILEDVEKFIRINPDVNIVALGHRGTIVLDFDDTSLFAKWKEHQPDTYTETTPRGGRHVFAYGEYVSGLQVIQGVELKRAVLVYPSVVDGKIYQRGHGELAEVGPDFFSSLSKPGTKSAYVLQIEQRQKRRVSSSFQSAGLVAQIKQHYDILQTYEIYRPQFKRQAHRVYYSVTCPFHDDHKPSMYLDAQRGLFKCHACGAHGDVINLYALFEKISVREAVARMARSLPGVRS